MTALAISITLTLGILAGIYIGAILRNILAERPKVTTMHRKRHLCSELRAGMDGLKRMRDTASHHAYTDRCDRCYTEKPILSLCEVCREMDRYRSLSVRTPARDAEVGGIRYEWINLTGEER